MPRIKDKYLHEVRYAMIKRCYQSNNKDYKWYGERGITVCDEWKKSSKSFIDWAKKNGYKHGLWLDRIDNNGNYEPNNCRFITPQEQQRNRRNNFLIEYKGEKRLVIELANQYHIKYTTLKKRLRLGWDIEKALKTPVRKIANSNK